MPAYKVFAIVVIILAAIDITRYIPEENEANDILNALVLVSFIVCIILLILGI